MSNTVTHPPGQHALLDCFGAKGLQDAAFIERAMRDAAAACGATVLHINLHSFGEGAGITGVAILAESHISIHTWPESGYAALDIFVCGGCLVQKAVDVLLQHFAPMSHKVDIYQRGA